MSKHSPLREVFTDVAGKQHVFEYKVGEVRGGYLVRAVEVCDGPDGYEIEVFAAEDIPSALDDLRAKIRRELSTQYLEEIGGEFYPRDHALKGRVASRGVVIDGLYVSFDDLARMMQSYEGFVVVINFLTGSDDVNP